VQILHISVHRQSSIPVTDAQVHVCNISIDLIRFICSNELKHIPKIAIDHKAFELDKPGWTAAPMDGQITSHLER